MRLYYLSDIHYKGTNPPARTDDYSESILNKLQQVFDKAIHSQNRIDGIICGGDLFDIPNVSDGVKNKLITKLQVLKQEMIPFYMTLGSHDYMNYNFLSIDRSSIGVLIASNLIKMPSKSLSFSQGGIDTKIYFYHHTHGLLDDLSVFEIDKSDADYSIQVIHETIVEKPLPFKHVLLDDLPKDKMGDLVLLGHYHGSFQKKYGNQQFINTGSFGRKEKTSRIPSYLEITIDADGITTEKHTVECETDIFADNKLVAVSDEERDSILKEYLSKFGDAADFSLNTDPIEFMESIATNLEVDENVITFLKSELLNQMNEGV